MIVQTRIAKTFPSIRIPASSGGLPIEVSLIAQLGHGEGNQLFSSVASRQSSHKEFVDELDEPSAKIGGTDYHKGDFTSLYTFTVGPNGHPFHRHAGHRVFTAVSGSGGAQLRFSSASDQQIAEDPQNFIKALRFVNIPPDCLFTVRFGGDTWHQFYPLSRNTLHPVFFALSCHTNELGGRLSDELKQRVIANETTIPSLTEVLPSDVLKLLHSANFQEQAISTTILSLDAPPGTLHRKVCDTFRGHAGKIRGGWSTWHDTSGFESQNLVARNLDVKEFHSIPDDSILQPQLEGQSIHHTDTFRLNISDPTMQSTTASRFLAYILEGFLMNAPKRVSRLMTIRNILVAPLGLRTSPLGCPVSSLLSDGACKLFSGQYPVLDQHINLDDSRAEVLLGADDKHLVFRSFVGVNVVNKSVLEVSLGNKIHCKNLFGQFYMIMISRIHRRYIVPIMLRYAVGYAMMKVAQENILFQRSGV
jgi:hypothetical protein